LEPDVKEFIEALAIKTKTNTQVIDDSILKNNSCIESEFEITLEKQIDGDL
jgi:hypothetical protein